jgi:hypothetical protein
VSNVDSSTFTSTASYTAAPAYVQLASGALQSTAANTPLSQPIKVIVTDANGNNLSGVTVNWSISGNGGTFSSSTSITDSTGTASINLTMGNTPGNFNVTATAGGIASQDLIQETSTAATAQFTNLALQTQPSNQNQQNIIFSAQPVLSLTTGSGGAYSTPTTVTAAAYSNQTCSVPASTPLSGTLSVQSNASGIATFTDLKYSTQSSLFIKFTAGTQVVCSNEVVVVPQASSSTQITLADAPSSVYTGVQFNFIVNITDSSASIISSATNQISVSAFTDSTCSTPATGTLSNSSPISAYQGQALFNSLAYSNVETIYIKAQSSGLTPLCSTGIQIKQSPLKIAKSLAFLSTPTDETAGTTFSIQPFANVNNLIGTLYQGPAVPMNIGAYSDATCSTSAPGTLNGTTTIQSSFGSGEFSGLSYSQGGTIYLGLTSPGLISACSPALTMTGTAVSNPASKLAWISGSSTPEAGVCSAYIISAQDQNSSPVIESSFAISLAGNGSGAFYSDSSCSNSVTSIAMTNSSSVTVYFKNTIVESTIFTASGLSVTQGTFPITSSATTASKLAFVTQPQGSVVAGFTFNSFSVAVKDQYNNTVVTDSSIATLSAYSDNNCSTVSNNSGLTGVTAPNSGANGVATFTTASATKAQGIYLKVTDGSLTSVCSNLVTITPAAYSLANSSVTAPSSVNSGSTITATLITQDSFGNLNPTNLPATSNIVFTASAVGGTGNFGATTSLGSGVYSSVFTSSHAGSITLGAKISGSAVANSASVTINAEGITQLVFRQQPSTVGNTSNVLSQQPIIETDDATGSITTSSAPLITLTAYSDTCVTPVSGGLTATTNPLTPSGGSATFTGVQALKTSVTHIGASDGTHSVCSVAMTIAGTGWIGATNGVWSLASNWSPATVPNSTSAAAVFNALSANNNVSLDINATVNQLNNTQDTTAYILSATASNKLTFDGSSPSLNINSSKAQSISAPLIFSGTNPSITVASSSGQTDAFTGAMTFNADTSITAANNSITMSGILNGTGKNISLSGPVGQAINLTNAGSGLVGGTVSLLKGTLNADPGSLGGAAGPKIIVSNLNATKFATTSASNFANNIQLNDTGTNPFIFQAPFRSTGSIAGNITHDIIVSTGNSTGLAGDLSGLVFSNGAKIVFGQNDNGQLYFFGGLSASLQSNVEVDLGSGGTIAPDIISVKFNSNGDIANPIKVRPGSVTTGRWIELATGAGTGSSYTSTNFTGNIVLNSDGTAGTGSHLFTGYYGGYSAFKISGVMSNGASGAANIDFNVGNLLTLSGANTYTSQTFVGLFSPWNNYGFLNLTGSINSSLTTINANSILYHSGTINGNVSALSGSTINAGSVDFSQPVTVSQTYLPYSAVTPHDAIINGNFTSAGATVHRFGMGGGTSDSKLIVNGNITLSGSVVPISIAAGTHTLMTYTGTRTGTFGSSVPGQPGSVITYDDANKKITATLNSPVYYNLSNVGGSFISSYAWEAGAPPASDLVDVISLAGTSTNDPLDQNITLNHLDVSSTAKTVSGTKTLTFGGTNATLSGTTGLTISAPITLAADLAITGTGPFTLGAITSSGYNISQTATSVTFNTASTMIGGIYDLISGILNINNLTGLGGASGMTIKVENTSANTLLQTQTTFANPVVLNDTGANNFTIKSTNSGATLSGSITGNLTTNNLLLSNTSSGYSLTLSGNMSGLNMGGINGRKIILGGSNMITTIGSSTFPACQVDLGTGVGALGNNSAAFSVPGTYTNNFNILGNTSGTVASNTITGASNAIPTTFSGNIIVNSNSSTFAGNTATFSAGTQGVTTFSGVISNAGNPSNVTVGFGGTGASITGNNTYTSNTQITGSGDVDISGSIANSPLTTVANSTRLYLTGTTGAVTTGSGSGLFTYRYSTVATPTSTSVATINGNLTMVAGTTYYVKTGTSNTSSYAAVTGNVSLGSAPFTVTTPTTGTFTLMTWTGTRTGTFGTVTTSGKTNNGIVYDDVSMPRKATITIN